MPFRPTGHGAGVGEYVDGGSGNLDLMLHAGHGRSRQVRGGVFRFPVEGAEQVIHQRKNDVEIAFLHHLATVMQFVQAPHLANPRQARQRIVRWQMLTGVKHLISQVTEHQATADQPGDIGIELLEQPPYRQGNDQCVQHDQPGWKQDHPPVAGTVVGHVPGGEKTVMVTGVTRIEHSREGFFVMAQVSMHNVNAEVEKQ
ncbi:hypothetical protein D3C85_719950 [compost metagenome]